MLESGDFGTMNELAAAEKINPSYVSRMLRLTLLAPEMVDAILDGRQPEGMTLPALLEAVPVGWREQRSQCGAIKTRMQGSSVTIRRIPRLFDLHAVAGAMFCCFFQFQGSNS
jgi:hypothetical protein